jgi:hypothetical protein
LFVDVYSFFPSSISTVYRGPFVTIKQTMASFVTIPFLGGTGDFFSCGAEGMAQVRIERFSLNFFMM